MLIINNEFSPEETQSALEVAERWVVAYYDYSEITIVLTGHLKRSNKFQRE